MRIGCGESPQIRAGFVLAVLLWSASALAEPSQEDVRVLLAEGHSRVRIAGIELTPGVSGVRARGRDAGALWQTSERGPHAFGAERFRGTLEVSRDAGGLRVINRLGVEEYVAGIVGREIYPNWQDETLKAQAVISRTYALRRRRERVAEAYDVGRGTSDQVYGGVSAETPRIRAAVTATAGQRLVASDGEPILAAFHSASGGHTASAAEVWGEPVPYLIGQPVENEDDSPDTYWRATVTGTTLQRALSPLGFPLGEVHEVRIIARSPSGRVGRLLVEGTEGSGSLTGRTLRSALGEGVLRSTLFEVNSEANEDSDEATFVFVGSGHGHGVGLSQWGAEAMARRGATYLEILQTFYPGTELRGALSAAAAPPEGVR